MGISVDPEHPAARWRRRRIVWSRLAVAVAAVTVAASGCSSAASNVVTSAGAGSTASSTSAPGGAQPGGSGAPGAPGDAAPGGAAPGGGSTTAQYSPTGAYTLSSGSATKSSLTYNATDSDESAVLVNGTGNLTLIAAMITSSGASKSSDESSFYGLNAGVLAQSGGTVTLSGGTVTTTGDGANGIFAYGTSTITASNLTIKDTGQYAHGAMASGGGTVNLTNVNIATAGASSGAIATDRGGGTINATGGTITTSGANSPAIYSTGNITVGNATLSSSGSEVAVIEGGNSITAHDSSLTSTLSGKWGVMIYQSMSGDAAGTRGTFTMTGGSLSYSATGGPLFYVTNSTGVISLKGVAVTAGGGVLIKAATGSWGTTGSNGGTVVFTADGETLTGDLVSDASSSIAATLQNGTSLTGAINAAAVTLDATSSWTVTADSALTTLSDASGISGTTITNIAGNGHTVSYDASLSANAALGGKTYSLAGGGTLTPKS